MARSMQTRMMASVAFLLMTYLVVFRRTPSDESSPRKSSQRIIAALREADTKLISQASSFSLKGFYLIPSYHGVITLVFAGWPQSAMNAKQALDVDVIPYMSSLFDGAAGGVLVREGGGSKFPKTSLGALCDECTLSWAEYERLLSICNKWSQWLRDDNFTLDIDSVSIVFLKDRVLAQRDIIHRVHLQRMSKHVSKHNGMLPCDDECSRNILSCVDLLMLFLKYLTLCPTRKMKTEHSNHCVTC